MSERRNIVHVYDEQALCGFPGIPDDWPSNHTLVYLEMPWTHHLVTCPKCKTALNEARGAGK